MDIYNTIYIHRTVVQIAIPVSTVRDYDVLDQHMLKKCSLKFGFESNLHFELMPSTN